MLSKPDDWKFNFTNFKKSLGIGDKAIRTIIKMLEDLKYLKRERIQDKNGHYEWNYFINEEPYDMELKRHNLPYAPEGQMVEGDIIRGNIYINTELSNDKYDKTKDTAKKIEKTSKEAVKISKRMFDEGKRLAIKGSKATAKGIKILFKATVSAIKVIIAGVKSLISAIVAGGSVAAIVILIICLIGLLVASMYGIFFSSEDTGNNIKMSDCINELNQEMDNKIKEFENKELHDEVVIESNKAEWLEVLSVYTVRISNGNKEQVMIIDQEKKENIKRSILGYKHYFLRS